MISYVNGYLCTSSCDVAKAKRGVDPHPKTNDPQNVAKPDAAQNRATAANDSAVVFGGALRALAASMGVAPAGSAQPSAATTAQQPGQSVNILV